MLMIYFLRHGESEANANNRFAGRDDSPLTEKGKLQAQVAAEEFKAKGIIIDRIICSPLARSIQTANIVADYIGFDISNIELDERITERDLGELTGKNKSEITDQQRLNPVGSEDIEELYNRVVSAYKEYTRYEGNVLLVSHSGVGRALQCIKKGLSHKNIYQQERYPNAHIIPETEF